METTAALSNTLQRYHLSPKCTNIKNYNNNNERAGGQIKTSLNVITLFFRPCYKKHVGMIVELSTLGGLGRIITELYQFKHLTLSVGDICEFYE